MARLAWAIVFCCAGLDPYCTWYLGEWLEDNTISQLAKKIELIDDGQGWVDWLATEKYPCTVWVRIKKGKSRSVKIKSVAGELAEVYTGKQLISNFEANALFIIGEKRVVKLYDRLTCPENNKVSKLMRLTYPGKKMATLISPGDDQIV